MTHAELQNGVLLRRALERLAPKLATDTELQRARPDPEILHALEARTSTIELVAEACKRYASRPALGRRVSDRSTAFATLTYEETWARIQSVASGLAHKEWAKPGARVGLCGAPSPEYVIAQLACLYLCATAVPFSTTMYPDDLRHVLEETELDCVFVSGESARALRGSLAPCSKLRGVVIFDAEERDEAPTLDAPSRGVSVTTIAELERVGRAHGPVDPVVPAPDTDPLQFLAYTSGSSGAPKGALFPERVWRRHWSTAARRVPADFPWIAVHFLPLHHLGGQVRVAQGFARGGVTYFTLKSDMSTFFEDVRLARPTVLMLVPRVAGLIYEEHQRSAARGDELGDRITCAMTGSAPPSEEVLAFLMRRFQVPVLRFYGSTENGLVTMDEQIDRHDVAAYKLVDVPELGYRATDKPYPRGELLLRSARSIPGYFKNPKASAELYDAEGFARTGDIFEERAPWNVVWVARRNEILKLAQGEFVNLARLEGLYEGSRGAIRQAFLYGNARRAYLVGVIVAGAGLADASDAAARAAIRNELSEIAARRELRSYEVPRDFILERAPFSIENGLLTASRKLARQKLNAKYGDALERLYEALEAEHLRALAQDAPVLEKIRKAFVVTFGVTEVADTDTFVGLGGDSLSAMRLRTVIDELCHVRVPLGVIFSPGSSVKELTAFVERTSKADLSR